MEECGDCGGGVSLSGSADGLDVSAFVAGGALAGQGRSVQFTVTEAAYPGTAAPDGTWVVLRTPFAPGTALLSGAGGQPVGQGGLALPTSGGVALAEVTPLDSGGVTLEVSLAPAGSAPSAAQPAGAFTELVRPTLVGLAPPAALPGATVVVSAYGLNQVSDTGALLPASVLAAGAPANLGPVSCLPPGSGTPACSADLTVPGGLPPGAAQVVAQAVYGSSTLASSPLSLTVQAAGVLLGGPLAVPVETPTTVSIAVYGTGGLSLANGAPVTLATTLGTLAAVGGGGAAAASVVVPAQGGTVQAVFRGQQVGTARLSIEPPGVSTPQPVQGGTVAVTPLVASLTPAAARPGQTVQVTGGGFAAGAAVAVAGVPSVTVSVYGPTSLAFTVPTAAVTGPVTVSVAGEKGTGPVLHVPLVVTGFSPSSGPPGAAVTIDGSGFGVPDVSAEGIPGEKVFSFQSVPGQAAVSFNGTDAFIRSWTPTEIVALVPEGAGNGPLVVTVAGVAVTAGTFFSTAGLTSLLPAEAAAGQEVTVNGGNLGSVPGQITLDGQAVTPDTWTATAISFTVPDWAVTGPVRVVTASGQDAGTLTLQVAPFIGAVVPSAGVAGATLTLDGFGFGPSAGTVDLGAQALPVMSWSPDAVQVELAPFVPSGDLTLTTAAGLGSNAVAFTVNPSFTLAAAGPGQGAGGTYAALPDSVLQGVTLTASQQEPTSTGTPSPATAGLPSWASVQFTPDCSAPGGCRSEAYSWAVTLQVGAAAPPGTYPFRFTASAGGFTASLPATLVVSAPPQGLVVPMLVPGQTATMSGSVAGSPLAPGGGTVALTADGQYVVGASWGPDGTVQGQGTPPELMSGITPAQAAFSNAAGTLQWTQDLSINVGASPFQVSASPDQVVALPAGSDAGFYPGQVEIHLSGINAPTDLQASGPAGVSAAVTGSVAPDAAFQGTATLSLAGGAASLTPGATYTIFVSAVEQAPGSVPQGLNVPVQVLYPGLTEQIYNAAGRLVCTEMRSYPLALNSHGYGGWPLGPGVPYSTHWSGTLLLPAPATFQAVQIADDYGDATLGGQPLNIDSWVTGNEGPGTVSLPAGGVPFTMDSTEADGLGGAGTGLFWTLGGTPLQVARQPVWATALPKAGGASCFQVVAADPPGGVVRSGSGGLQVTFAFNEVVDAAGLQAGTQAVSVQQGLPAPAVAWTVDAANPTQAAADVSGLPTGAYAIALTPAVTDAAGDHLQAPFNYDFVVAPDPVPWETVTSGGSTYTVWVQAKGQAPAQVSHASFLVGGQAGVVLRDTASGIFTPVALVYATDATGSLVTDPVLQRTLVVAAEEEGLVDAGIPQATVPQVDANSGSWAQGNGPGSDLGNGLCDLAQIAGQGCSTPSDVQVYQAEIATALANAGPPTSWVGELNSDLATVDALVKYGGSVTTLAKDLSKVEGLSPDGLEGLAGTIDALHAVTGAISIDAQALNTLYMAEWEAAAAASEVRPLQQVAAATTDPDMQAAIAGLVNFNLADVQAQIAGIFAQDAAEQLGTALAQQLAKDLVAEFAADDVPLVDAVVVGLNLGFFLASFTGWEQLRAQFYTAAYQYQAEQDFLGALQTLASESVGATDAGQLQAVLLAQRLVWSSAADFYGTAVSIANNSQWTSSVNSLLATLINGLGGDVSTSQQMAPTWSSTEQALQAAEADPVPVLGSGLGGSALGGALADFPGASSTPSQIEVETFSPVSVWVTDALGRHAGIDPGTGQWVDQIPGATLTGHVPGVRYTPYPPGLYPPSDEVLLTIPDPVPGALTVQTTGTGSGVYHVHVVLQAGGVVLSDTGWSGRATPGVSAFSQLDVSPEGGSAAPLLVASPNPPPPLPVTPLPLPLGVQQELGLTPAPSTAGPAPTAPAPTRPVATVPQGVVAATIGPAGGTLATANGGWSVTFPAGALAVPSRVTLGPAAAPAATPPGTGQVAIGPESLSVPLPLQLPAEVSVALPKGTAQVWGLSLWEEGGGTWLNLGGRLRPAPGGGYTLQADVVAGGALALVAARTTFTDVPAGYWAADAIAAAAARGWVQGFGDGTYGPAAPTARAQWVAMLVRAAGAPPTAAGPAPTFADVAGSAWYAPALGEAAAAGWMIGVAPDVFAPAAPLTRGQAVLSLWRADGRASATGPAAAVLAPFADGPKALASLPAEEVQALAWSVGAGILRGEPGTLLDPDGALTRAQAAVLLARWRAGYEG